MNSTHPPGKKILTTMAILVIFSFFSSLAHPDPGLLLPGSFKNDSTDIGTSLLLSDTPMENTYQRITPRISNSISLESPLQWTLTMDKSPSFQWDINPMVSANPISSHDYAQLKLYEGKFRDVNYIQQDMAEKIAAESLTQLLETTRTGKKLRSLEKSIANYFTVGYSSHGNSNQRARPLPGKKKHHGSGYKTNDYGFSLSGKLGGSSSYLTSPVFEVHSWFNSMEFNANYNTFEQEVNCELTNRSKDGDAGFKPGLGFTANANEIAAVIKVHLEF